MVAVHVPVALAVVVLLFIETLVVQVDVVLILPAVQAAAGLAFGHLVVQAVVVLASDSELNIDHTTHITTTTHQYIVPARTVFAVKD